MIAHLADQPLASLDDPILVTGGAGSFGRQFVRWVLANTNCPRICILSRDEDKHRVFLRGLGESDRERVRFFIGDIRDLDRLRLALRGITTVVHAAALKQVPAGEYNPDEFVQTNVVGTMNVARACIENGITSALLLSTDKACAPVNLYGATKLCAEKSWRAANSLGKTAFGVVRYGNVMGSRGSVLPIWADLIARDSPTPITHRDMTRFWMSIEEAVGLVTMVLEVMRGGELFVPKLHGFNIRDLAEAMWLRAGKPPVLGYVGIRPGEKLHESLLTIEESAQAWDLGDVYVLSGVELGQDQMLHAKRAIAGGRRIRQGFRYSSDNVTQMSVDQLNHAITLTQL